MTGDEKFVNVSFDTLYKLEHEIFKGMGVPDKDAKICADVLIEADKKGIDSHGVGRLYMYYVRCVRKQQEVVTKITVERDKKAIARLNAHNGMGQPVSHMAMEMAIKKAKEFGIGMVTVGDSNHYGIAGYYSLMAAKEGCIGINGTNARPSTAPTWGYEPILGTNPLTIAMPTDWSFPWFADHATSITQRGKIEAYARLGKPLLPGWVINAAGDPATDARKTLNDLIAGTAALAPLGGAGEDLAGFKGYNYSTLVEILSSALSTANFCSNCLGFKKENGKKVEVPFGLGHFFIAIDVEAFEDLAVFKKKVGDILRFCANSKKITGAKKIYVAGEKEYEIETQRAKTGIPLSEETQLQLQQMMQECKIDDKKYNIKWAVKYTGKADAMGW